MITYPNEDDAVLKLVVSILVQYLIHLSIADVTEEFSPGGVLSGYLTLWILKFWSERWGVGADKVAFSVRDMLNNPEKMDS